MIPKGLFTQIAMLAVAAAIVMTYIRPELAGVGATQSTIETYKAEITKVSEVNTQLQSLLSKLDSVSNDDRRALLAYLPDAVDEIGIPRDLYNIATEAGLIYLDSAYVGPADLGYTLTEFERGDIPDAHRVSLTVEGTYDQIKRLFAMIERSNYPLEIYELDLRRINGDFLAVELNMVTYSYHKMINQQVDL